MTKRLPLIMVEIKRLSDKCVADQFITRMIMSTKRMFLLFIGIGLMVGLWGCDGDPDVGPAPTLVAPTRVGDGNGDEETPPATAESIGAATATLPGEGEEGESGEATPTLQATATPSPSPAATVVTEPPATPVRVAALPSLAHNLLFIADGNLRLWQNGQAQTVLARRPAPPTPTPEATAVPSGDVAPIPAGEVISFQLTENGRSLMAAQITAVEEVNDRAIPRSDLFYVNLRSGEQRAVLTGVPGLRELTLAGNGETAAIISQPPPAADQPVRSLVTVFDVGDGQTRTQHQCASTCTGLTWHPDNQNVVWSEGENGVWLYNRDAREPERLLAADALSGATYRPAAWADNGRYLLLWQTAGDGNNWVVFDVPTGQRLTLPDSDVSFGAYHLQLTWMADHRLFVVRPPLTENDSGMLQLWRVQLDAGQIVKEEEMALPQVGAAPAAPQHLEDGRFAFALLHPEDADVSGLYLLKGFGDTLERVGGAPPALASDAVAVAWAPGGDGAIVQHSPGGAFYADLGEETLYALQPALGDRLHTFRWAP